MKIISLYSKILTLCLFILIAFSPELTSQGTDSRRPGPASRASKVSMTLWVNPLKTEVYSGEIKGVSGPVIETGSTVNGAMNLDLFFSRAAGFTLGVGYNTFASQLSVASWSDDYSTKDSETESYVLTIDGTSIIESLKISFVHIPVGLTLRFPVEGKVGFSLNGGVGFNIPVVKSSEGSGRFSYSGYYSIYNVTLSNIPVYFPSNSTASTTGEIELKPMCLSLDASGSFFISLGRKAQLLIGGYYTSSLANILASEANSVYMISSKVNEMNSLWKGSSEAGFKAFGLKAGLRFTLK